MKREKLTKKQMLMAIEAIAGVGAIAGLFIYIGYDIGKTDSKILDIVIESAKEVNKVVTFERNGAQLYIVPEGINLT